MPTPLVDFAWAFGALLSCLLVGVAALRMAGATLRGFELAGYGAGCGVLTHAMIGLVVACCPAKQAVAGVLLGGGWAVAAVTLWRKREGAGMRGLLPGWEDPGVRPALAILGAFVASCVGMTHLQVRFPAVALPDGVFIFKEHALPVKMQVLTGNLPVDNYLPFVVEEFLLRDISFVREHPIIPGQEVSNRPILLALAVVPFRAAFDPPARQQLPLDRFTYLGTEWPDVGVFMEGPGYREFLSVSIAFNALVLLGGALLLARHAPRFILIPGLLLLSTSPFYLEHTLFSWPKLLAAFYLLLALHALARGFNSAWVAAAGVLAYYSHPYALVYLVGFGGHYAWAAARRRSDLVPLVRYALTAGLALEPWFGWTYLVLPAASDLLSQNLTGHGVDGWEMQAWVRIVNLHKALGAGMLGVYPFTAQGVLQRAVVCLPGVLALLAIPAAVGCFACLRTHRVLVLQGVIFPAFLLLLPFGREASVVRLGYQAVGVCLVLLGLIVIARWRRAALGVVGAQICLQVILLAGYGRALGATFSDGGEIYRLLDHRPVVRDAHYPVNFHVDLAVGKDHAETIWSEPPTSLLYRRITLPAGNVHFRGRIAIHPLVWSDGRGDGAEFVLVIRASDSVSTDDPGRTVWSMTLDPTHRPEQRAWIPVDVDLAEFAGKTIDLLLKNSAGPNGDDYADWCLWADPQLVRPTP